MTRSRETARLKVDLNGELVPEGEAQVSVFDRGFLYGDGVFETLRVYNGTAFRSQAHWDRLRQSASLIRLDIPFTESDYIDRLERVVSANGLTEAAVRVTVSRGVGPRRFTLNYEQRPTTIFSARPLPGYPEEMYHDGVKIVIAATRRNSPDALNPAAKSANFLNSVLARAEAEDAGAFEAVMLNAEGFLTEGSTTNLFAVRRNELLTPSLECGVLPGITRATVLEIAPELGIKTAEAMLRPEDMWQADEVFITNSTAEIMSVVEVENQSIGDGMPGKVTQELHEAYRELVKEECYAK
jgi:branched-chain amino acid aminotransferase